MSENLDADRHNRTAVSRCNCLGRYDDVVGEMPMIRIDDSYFTDPTGLKIVAPNSCRPASVDEIVRALRDQGDIMLTGFGESGHGKEN